METKRSCCIGGPGQFPQEFGAERIQKFSEAQLQHALLHDHDMQRFYSCISGNNARLTQSEQQLEFIEPQHEKNVQLQEISLRPEGDARARDDKGEVICAVICKGICLPKSFVIKQN